MLKRFDIYHRFNICRFNMFLYKLMGRVVFPCKNTYLLVCKHNKWFVQQSGLSQQFVHLIVSLRKLLRIRCIHHKHQYISILNKILPIFPHILTATNCERRGDNLYMLLAMRKKLYSLFIHHR